MSVRRARVTLRQAFNGDVPDVLQGAVDAFLKEKPDSNKESDEDLARARKRLKYFEIKRSMYY